MDLSGIAGLIIVIVFAGLMVFFVVWNRRFPPRGMRPIQAIHRLRRAIGLAVEDGSRLHISLGSASLNTYQSASALLGLSVLGRIAEASSISDRPPVATSGDGALAVLSQDTLRSAYDKVNALDLYDPTRGRVTGLTPFSYVAGALPVFSDEQISANALVGNFGPELALLLDTADKAGAFTLAASDSLTAQGILFAAAEEPLIGEELFAISAYLGAGAFHTASLRVQDYARWALIAGLVLGSILKLVGVL